MIPLNEVSKKGGFLRFWLIQSAILHRLQNQKIWYTIRRGNFDISLVIQGS